MKTTKRFIYNFNFICTFIYTTIFYTDVFGSETGSGVSNAIEKTWESALDEIKTVTNKVIFPAISVVLVIALFIKGSTAYFDYKKNGQFDFLAPLLLFVGLIFSLVATSYVWDIIK